MRQFVKLLMIVPNFPGAKLSAFTMFVPNCLFCFLGAKLFVFLLGGKLLLLLFLGPIVRVSNCPVRPGAELS